ncbi:hypothetical protein [Massilia niastensis]|uniref:hypothetical protein n=1 Tax=Massilia niastensis TaxID=544911 RepID=UPI000371706B|nr:hypothetical protein [Massilia niastensis]
MSEQIVRVVDFAIVDQLRTDLLSVGVERDHIEMCAPDDEAGPVQANFTVGDDPKVKGGTDYNDVYRPSGQQHSPCLVTVDTSDDRQRDQVLAILERYGAKDWSSVRH